MYNVRLPEKVENDYKSLGGRIISCTCIPGSVSSLACLNAPAVLPPPRAYRHTQCRDWALHKPCPSAFSLPVPSGGLSTRTRRLWGHRIWSPRFYDFRSFPLQSNLEDCLLKASNLLHLQLLTLRQGQVNAIRNVVENQKSPEVLKSRTSNRVSPDPPGPRAQASRRLWGREWLHRRCIWR